MPKETRSARHKTKSNRVQIPVNADIEVMLRKHPLFSGVDSALWQPMIERARMRRFEAQANVLSQDEHSSAVYIVLAGTVKVYYAAEDGTDVILALCGAGELLGEIGVVDGQLPSANVMTLEDSVLMSIERDVFLETLRAVPELSLNLAIFAMQRVRSATSHIRLLSQLNAKGRISAQLLIFAERYGQPAGASEDGAQTPRTLINLRLTQNDFAELMAISRVHMNQILNSLRREGAIDFDDGRFIVVCDEELLRENCRIKRSKTPVPVEV